MELAMASGIGILVAAAVYLLLRARSFDVILGLTLLSYATNLLIFSAGRLVADKPPVLREGVPATLAEYTDPLPQALVLTAIVIAFAMTAVTIVLAMRSRADNDSDHVDGTEPLRKPVTAQARQAHVREEPSRPGHAPQEQVLPAPGPHAREDAP